eukprot:4435950-Amphidinium_carterae.1
MANCNHTPSGVGKRLTSKLCPNGLPMKPHMCAMCLHAAEWVVAALLSEGVDAEVGAPNHRPPANQPRTKMLQEPKMLHCKKIGSNVRSWTPSSKRCPLCCQESKPLYCQCQVLDCRA